MYNDALALNDSKQHSIKLEIDDNLDIYGDEGELRSAFSNLLMNAVKYTQDKGNIVVRWFCDEDGVHMEVEDDGIGIDPKHIPRLTERFYRADPSRHAKTGGTGLGRRGERLQRTLQGREAGENAAQRPADQDADANRAKHRAVHDTASPSGGICQCTNRRDCRHKRYF